MLLTGVFRANREPIGELFSDDLNFGRPIFRAAMPRERMKNILRFLRFDNHETRSVRVIQDKLGPMRDVFDEVNKALNCAYHPGKFVTIDEHLSRYRGHCPFRQYMPNKPDKYGIKIWALADAKNFYPINLEVCTGKNNSLSNKPEELSLRMVTNLSPGHVVVGDNYFSSLSICNRSIKEKQLFYIGTIRHLRREIPNVLKNAKGQQLYSSSFFFNDDTTLVSFVRSQNKSVLLLSNVHHDKEISSAPKYKPAIILSYNANKSGVDKLDQMAKEFKPYRATRRWPCVLFFSILSFATQASWVLFCLKYPEDVLVKTKNRKKFIYKLSLQLIRPLIQKRKESSEFRFLSTDVKDTINAICNPPERKAKKNDSGSNKKFNNKDSTTNIVSAPVPNTSEITSPPTSTPSDIVENLDSFALFPNPIIAEGTLIHTQDQNVSEGSTHHQSFNDMVVQDSCQLSNPDQNSNNASANSSQIAVAPANALSVSDDSTSISSKLQLTRTGRCKYCGRPRDKQTKKKCEFCYEFICPEHSKTVYVCIGCEDKVI